MNTVCPDLYNSSFPFSCERKSVTYFQKSFFTMTNFNFEYKSFESGQQNERVCTCSCIERGENQTNSKTTDEYEYENMANSPYDYAPDPRANGDDAYIDYGKYGGSIGDGDLADPYEYEYEKADEQKEKPNRDLQATKAPGSILQGQKFMPLQGNCEKTCLKLNLLHDGGFSSPCDEETAYNEFPYCDGDPAADDRFHMRQCIMTCRQPPGEEGCPQMHKRGNDLRGCEAAKAFRIGLPYEFVTRDGESVVFQSLVTPQPSSNPTKSPSQSPSEELIFDKTYGPTGDATGKPTSFRPTGQPSAAPVPSIPSYEPTSGPTGTTVPTIQTITRSPNEDQVGIILAVVFGLIFMLIICLFFAIAVVRARRRRQEDENQIQEDGSGNAARGSPQESPVASQASSQTSSQFSAQLVEEIIEEVNSTVSNSSGSYNSLD